MACLYLPVLISSKIAEPMVYGKFLVEKGTPLPYEWSHSNIKVRRKMKYLILEIKK